MTVELILPPKGNTIDGFPVWRALPRIKRRSIGPFVFLDQMGPTAFDAGKYLDVAPHPHIGLSTITWLIEGEILHRDSLGSELVIRPGEVNWMTAGAGIVHSERSPDAQRHAGARIFGMQAWTALPKDREDTAPSFQHYPSRTIPEVTGDGATASLIVGSGWGEQSPVVAQSETLYAQIVLAADGNMDLPDAQERAIYVATGAVSIDGGSPIVAPCLAVLGKDARTISADRSSLVMLLGGEPLDGPRAMDWNFVSSDPAKIATARERWLARDFPTVPGDNGYTPYPSRNTN
ncbi:pirin family protein [Rhodospirillaceae bacterium KN72]|uniref:Pirin family protein n=1 Tax=Pacificispira spongiicola TaxID=2729598 RepID=A0A7Y0DX15_9PROT|nr:pirin family protein [Pacificispira spongiicola]NMM43136.1 pirin family protein [Pacificispira spongiicola]